MLSEKAEKPWPIALTCARLTDGQSSIHFCDVGSGPLDDAGGRSVPRARIPDPLRAQIRTETLRHDFLWYLTYSQNFLIAFETKSWGSFTHTWSLAVEQQFYVVFALIYLLIPLRRYGVTLLLLFAICLLAIWGLAAAHFGEITLYTLPFGGFLFIIAGGAVGFSGAGLPG